MRGEGKRRWITLAHVVAKGTLPDITLPESAKLLSVLSNLLLILSLVFQANVLQDYTVCQFGLNGLEILTCSKCCKYYGNLV